RTGIALSDSKRSLIVGRFKKRVQLHGLASFTDYYHFITAHTNSELQVVINLLTTNETYFFREEKHLNFLLETILPAASKLNFRVWSAASSSGEEAYSLAMIIADSTYPGYWEVVGSDISDAVLEKARHATYALENVEQIPERYRKKYCLKEENKGTFTFCQSLLSKVSFHRVNLMSPPTDWGKFDVIFLRNVLIYFDKNTKDRVVSTMVNKLKPNGYLIVGHAESLAVATERLTVIRPSVYHSINFLCVSTPCE
ncbi:MAG: protein-glutamate O-methyltransferase CheR, partial [Gammaproteobacteria bacterium]